MSAYAYDFSTKGNSYFNGRDVCVTRDDGRAILVNRKEEWWAVNVKSEYVMRQRSQAVQTAASNLAEGTLSGLEEQPRDEFWREVELTAANHGFDAEVYQEGRSGGWAALSATRNFESAVPFEPIEGEREMIDRWLAFCFDADELREQAEADFDRRILEANQELQIELSEYADWVGAEVQTLDGAVFKVQKLEVQYGRAALHGSELEGFSVGAESKLVRKADGNVPARLTADPIMEEVFAIIEARGDVSREQLDNWLELDQEHDPSILYEQTIAPAIDQIEAELTDYYRSEG